jgi:hypothetical protein
MKTYMVNFTTGFCCSPVCVQFRSVLFLQTVERTGGLMAEKHRLQFFSETSKEPQVLSPEGISGFHEKPSGFATGYLIPFNLENQGYVSARVFVFREPRL